VLDENNWVIDFGRLRPVKIFLTDLFDHNTLVAEDDPKMDMFVEMFRLGLIRLKVVKSTGCEAFALEIHDWISNWLPEDCRKRGVGLESVKVSEHGGNSAIYSPPRGRFLGWDLSADVSNRSPVRERLVGTFPKPAAEEEVPGT
jgi:6-pyruvoyl-tetrahydropterin synthase